MKRKEAYVFHNAGITYICTYPGQKTICYSKYFRRATRKARNLGYNVKVYKGECAKAPRDAVHVTPLSYILPAKGKRK